MVVVNLYAFEKTAAKPGVAFEELIENIDIGGPSMIRSAAKNFQDVAVVTSPADYAAIARGDAERTAASSPCDTQLAAGQKAFATTAAYDAAIAATPGADRAATAQASRDRRRASRHDLASALHKVARPALRRKSRIRRRRSYADGSGRASPTPSSSRARSSPTTTSWTCDAAWQLVAGVRPSPPRVIIKHTNPCGCAEQRRSSRPTRRPWPATRSRPSAASWRSTAPWTRTTAAGDRQALRRSHRRPGLLDPRRCAASPPRRTCA